MSASHELFMNAKSSRATAREDLAARYLEQPILKRDVSDLHHDLGKVQCFQNIFALWQINITIFQKFWQTRIIKDQAYKLRNKLPFYGCEMKLALVWIFFQKSSPEPVPLQSLFVYYRPIETWKIMGVSVISSGLEILITSSPVISGVSTTYAMQR